MLRKYSGKGLNIGLCYLGNDRPGMIDYMIWPWFERRPVVELTHPDAADYSQLKEKTTDVVSYEVLGNEAKSKTKLLKFECLGCMGGKNDQGSWSTGVLFVSRHSSRV